MHETPLMFRSFKWEQEKNKNIQEGIVKENKKPATRKEKKSKIMEFSLFLPLKTGYDNAIKELATKALPEQWYYGDETHASFPILKSYLNYTFDRLCTEDQDHVHDQYWVKKIKVSDDGRFCVFNTGLVDQLYDPIYAWFGKNEKREGGWIFRQFVKSSDREMQTLTRIFGTNMPETAHYYNSTSELVYDIRRDIGSYNWDHFVQRCDRLPIGFLKDNGPAFDYDRKEKNAQFYKELSIAIQNDKSSYKRIKDRIIDAINNALKRVKWNFKTAIPIYYPGQRAISLLLPLALTDGETIDCALVLESTDSNAYIAHTILTLKMAYNDARLITRPDSDWLVANKISDVSTNMTV